LGISGFTGPEQQRARDLARGHGQGRGPGPGGASKMSQAAIAAAESKPDSPSKGPMLKGKGSSVGATEAAAVAANMCATPRTSPEWNDPCRVEYGRDETRKGVEERENGCCERRGEMEVQRVPIVAEAMERRSGRLGNDKKGG